MKHAISSSRIQKLGVYFSWQIVIYLPKFSKKIFSLWQDTIRNISYTTNPLNGMVLQVKSDGDSLA